MILEILMLFQNKNNEIIVLFVFILYFVYYPNRLKYAGQPLSDPLVGI